MLVQNSGFNVWGRSLSKYSSPVLLHRNCDTQSSLATGPPATSFSAFLARLMLTTFLAGIPGHAVAQNAQSDGSAAARAGAIEHAQKMRRLFPDIGARHASDSACHSGAGDRPGPGRGDRDLPTERPHDNGEERLFPRSRNQRTHLLHLSSARKTVGRSVRSMRRIAFMPTPMTRCSDLSMAPPVLPTTSRRTGRSERPIACCWRKA